MNEENNQKNSINEQHSKISNEQPSVEIDSSENSENQSMPSLFQKFFSWWMRLPGSAKVAVGGAIYHAIIIFGIIVMIIIAIAAAAALSEGLVESIYGIGQDVQTFLTDTAGKLFTEKKFLSDEEWSEKQERKYYEKLNEVYQYYVKNYGVQIDTTLITATLFYGKGVADYIDDQDIASVEDNNYLLNDEEIIQDPGDFYKAARAQIKTLAKFQIVENTTYNACPNNYEPQSKITPESDKEVADTWAAFYGWNTRATFNYQDYQSISYPKIDGSARNVTWCEYQDAESQLRGAYQEDNAIYQVYKEKHRKCVEDCEAQQSCSPGPNGGKVCHSTCNPEVACIAEKEEMEKYYSLLEKNWSDVFTVSTGAFQCSSSSTWGSLNPYSDSKYYHNYRFPESWIEEADDYTFWKTAIDALQGLATGPISAGINKINCSAKPAISYTYSTSIEREGVYYYKLLSRNAELLSNKNFIEKYYPEYVGEDDDDDQRMKDAIKIVDEIYDVYEYAIQNRQYCDVDGVSSLGSGSVITSGSVFYSASNAEFVNLIANSVVEDMNRTGVLASVTIAQAMLESAHGTSGLTSKYNNYYGETAGKCATGIDSSIRGPIPPGSNGNTCSGNEYWNGTVVRMCNKSGGDCQWYRVYDGFENSTADHSMTFLRKNFNYCDPYLSDPLSYISCLEERPNHKYATDPSYVSKIMSTISTYNLTQYDIGAPSASVTENKAPIVGAGDSTEIGSEMLSARYCIPRTGTVGIGTMASSVSGGAQEVRGNFDRNSQDYFTFWESNNNLFYRSSKKLVNQCTWYAHGRGLEILTKNGMSMETAQTYMNPMAGDAWKWFGQNKYFSSSTDYTQPKIGAIIVWSRAGAAGHVAVIEDIEYGPNGEIENIYTSEGGVSIGGFQYRSRSLDYIREHQSGSGTGTYRFTGYVYLLD